MARDVDKGPEHREAGDDDVEVDRVIDWHPLPRGTHPPDRIDLGRSGVGDFAGFLMFIVLLVLVCCCVCLLVVVVVVLLPPLARPPAHPPTHPQWLSNVPKNSPKEVIKPSDRPCLLVSSLLLTGDTSKQQHGGISKPQT